MLGAMMYASKVAMAALPNVHLIGMFIVVFTLCFRVKALIPIYIYVFLEGILQGFNAWWAPYLYVWTILWAIVMILPKNMPKKVQIVVYPAVCGLHGFLFGTLYTPLFAFLMRMNTKAALAWIVAGLEFDAVHGVSNICLGLLIVPLTELVKKILPKK